MDNRGWTWFQGQAAIAVIRHNNQTTPERDEVFNFANNKFDPLPDTGMVTKDHVKLFKKFGPDGTLFNACQWGDVPNDAFVPGMAVVPVSVGPDGLPANSPGSTNDCFGLDLRKPSFQVTFARS